MQTKAKTVFYIDIGISYTIIYRMALDGFAAKNA